MDNMENTENLTPRQRQRREMAAARRKRERRNLIILASLLVVFVIAVVACIILLAGGGEDEAETTPSTELYSIPDDTEAPTTEPIADDTEEPTTEPTSEPTTLPTASISEPEAPEYIFPDSDSRYLSKSDYEGLSDWELTVARNEIFARHGRRFDDEKLQAYFDSCDWYEGTISPKNFDPSVFNDYELQNIKLLKAASDARG